MNVKYIKNEDIERVLIGVPSGHKHLRVILILKNETCLVFSEATIANILRGFVLVKTHPVIFAIELKRAKLEKRKHGFAEHQLIEIEKESRKIEDEIASILYGSGSTTTAVP